VNTDISQGSAATHLMCGGIFSDSIIIYFLLILTVIYSNFYSDRMTQKVATCHRILLNVQLHASV